MSEATYPPVLTMPAALPSRDGGLKVRAKSKPIMDPGWFAPITTTSVTSSHSGACPGQASTAVHAAADEATMPITIRERRSGKRPTR